MYINSSFFFISLGCFMRAVQWASRRCVSCWFPGTFPGDFSCANWNLLTGFVSEGLPCMQLCIEKKWIGRWCKKNVTFVMLWDYLISFVNFGMSCHYFYILSTISKTTLGLCTLQLMSRWNTLTKSLNSLVTRCHHRLVCVNIEPCIQRCQEPFV